MSTDLLESRETPVEIDDIVNMERGWSFPVPHEFRFFFGADEEQPSSYFPIKYMVDRIVGCVLLLPASIVIGVCCLAIKATSAGPAFFTQQRVGLGGRVFRIIKLRTMRLDAEAAGPVWCAGKHDPRITVLGRIFRKLHLDELPQLWNVAKGDMSLVGPRPERPEIIADLEQLIPSYHLRHNVKPGVTGLSQINLEPDTHINLTRRKQILDLRYIARASLWLDLRTLTATALRMLGIKGARVTRLLGLKQEIDSIELEIVNYEFGVEDHDLWCPGKARPH